MFEMYTVLDCDGSHIYVIARCFAKREVRAVVSRIRCGSAPIMPALTPTVQDRTEGNEEAGQHHPTTAQREGESCGLQNS